MARFRVTIRYDGGRRYELLDVEAATLRDALRRAADAFPAAAGATADLAEVRLQTEPGARGAGPF